ncbi:uncharacterized protein [Vicugna pacos]|uniref:Uncharacterized protein n=1 Tax=Vicugna pacos TaxID=30538 RepID=A0ABM5CH71_VICPA
MDCLQAKDPQGSSLEQLELLRTGVMELTSPGRSHTFGKSGRQRPQNVFRTSTSTAATWGGYRHLLRRGQQPPPHVSLHPPNSTSAPQPHGSFQKSNQITFLLRLQPRWLPKSLQGLQGPTQCGLVPLTSHPSCPLAQCTPARQVSESQHLLSLLLRVLSPHLSTPSSQCSNVISFTPPVPAPLTTLALISIKCTETSLFAYYLSHFFPNRL